MSSLNVRQYVLVSIVNFAFLSSGVLIGAAFSARGPAHWVVLAESAPQEAKSASRFEDITPGVTTGSMGMAILLAGRIAADELQVRGVDLLKLQEGTLNLLIRGKTISLADAQALLENARPEKILRFKPAEPAKPVKPEEAPRKEGK